jgi:putative DNA primase/helicase
VSEFFNCWFSDVPAGAYGYSYQMAGERFSNGSEDTLDALVTRIALLEKSGAQGVWFRCTTLNEAPMTGRGTAADTLAVPGVWADIDVAGPGHKHDGLPATISDALLVLVRSGLPTPTVVLSTGGGLSAWWKFSTPLLDIGQAASLSKHVHALLAGGSPGVKIDNVSDLARVMRAPGTTNRKPGVDAPCDVHSFSGFLYEPNNLAAVPLPVVPVVNHEPASLLDEGFSETRDAAAPRRFTLAEARAFCRTALKDLAGAQDGEINVRLNSAAKMLSHFGEEFWSQEAAEGWLLEALACTGYDGRTWKAEDTIRSAYGSSSSSWTAERVKVDQGKRPVVVGFTPAAMAEHVAKEVLQGDYLRAPGLGWFKYDGVRWAEVEEGVPGESVRQYVLERLIAAIKEHGARSEEAAGWTKFTTAAAIGAVVRLAGVITGVVAAAAEFDADPDVLNTPSGVVLLATGELRPHDPKYMVTKVTSGSYVPGYTHTDWEQALSAVTRSVRSWFQVRIGQAITGHPTDDGVVPLLQGGSGENGKGAITTDGLVPALGDYASPASVKLFSGRGEHSTEQADLRGRRLMIAEELTEGQSLNTTAIKRVADVAWIKARYTHQDNIEFPASHSLFMTSNFRPRVSETDGGTWRRLCLVVFPYTFVKAGIPLVGQNERRGDLGLKPRIRENATGQHDAIVTWAVEGAMRWYRWRAENDAAHAAGGDLPASPMLFVPEVAEATAAWRGESDRIAGFWAERLVVERGCSVVVSELLEEFNAWMSANGHNEWPKETFGPRFENHDVTRRSGAERRRSAKRDGLVRRVVNQAEPNWLVSGARKGVPVPEMGQLHIWVGIRYRIAADGLA